MKKSLLILSTLLLSSSQLIALNKNTETGKKLATTGDQLLEKIKQDDKKFEQIESHITKSLELIKTGHFDQAKQRLENAKSILKKQVKEHIEIREKNLQDPKYKEQLKEKYINPTVDEQLKKDKEKIEKLNKEIKELSK